MAAEPAPTPVHHSPEPGKKYFTLEEANRAIPYVSRVVDDIQASYRQAVEIRKQYEKQVAQGGDGDALDRDYDRAMDKLNALIDELSQVGVDLKDFEMGLVDFPAIHDDHEILLCWKRGEDAIVAWHETDAGFAGRQPVALLEEHHQQS